MSLYSALRSSVSSIQANSERVSMISNNISNSNSVGYKRISTSFSSFVGEDTENINFSAGGVRANAIRNINTQGELAITGNTTDMAIAGNGYFAVTKHIREDDNEGWQADAEILFTRRGDFSQDVNGNLRNSDGHYLLAWPQDVSNTGIKESSAIEDFRAINVAHQRVKPIASTELKISVNIIPETLAEQEFSIQYSFLDGKGNPHPAELTFQKIPAETSNLYFSITGDNLDKAVETTVPNGWRVYAKFIDNDQAGFRRYDGEGNDIGVASGQDVPIADVIFDSTGRLSNLTLPGTLSFYNQTELPIKDNATSNQLVEVGSDPFSRINLTALSANARQDIRRVLTESGVSELIFPSVTITDRQLLEGLDTLDTGDFPGAMPQIMGIINAEQSFQNTAGRQAAGYPLLDEGITAMTQYWPTGDTAGELARGRNSGDKYLVSRLIDGETGDLAPTLEGSDVLPGFSRHGFSKIAIDVDYDGSQIASAEDIQMTLDFGSMNLSGLVAGEQLNRSAVSVPVSANIGTGQDGTTQFSDTVSTVRNLENNGRTSSLLRDVTISNEGLITGIFNNGQHRSVGQVPLIVFANPNALSPAEGLSFSRNDDTGEPLVRLANSSEAGRIVGNSTESSSVDLAQEFADMIVSQRGFSASAKVVSTTQAMIDELSQRL